MNEIKRQEVLSWTSKAGENWKSIIYAHNGYANALGQDPIGAQKLREDMRRQILDLKVDSWVFSDYT